MFLSRMTDFILQSRVQAMAAAFLLAFIPLIGMISILIAALVTLRKGVVEGALVTFAATLPYLISYYASSIPAEQVQMVGMMLGVIVLGNILTWVFAAVLRQFSNWSFTLELAALLGVLAVGIVHLVCPDVQGWWSTQLTAYFAKTAQKVGELSSSDNALPAEMQQQVVAAMKQYATGVVVATLLLNSLLLVVVARWWQAAVFNPGGLRKELYNIRLSHITGITLALILILAYLGNEFALDVIPILCAVFFVAGLSLLHSAVQSAKNGWLWLVLIYAGIVVLFPMSFFMVSMIALFDTGMDFRKRFNF